MYFSNSKNTRLVKSIENIQKIHLAIKTRHFSTQSESFPIILSLYYRYIVNHYTIVTSIILDVEHKQPWI